MEIVWHSVLCEGWMDHEMVVILLGLRLCITFTYYLVIIEWTFRKHLENEKGLESYKSYISLINIHVKGYFKPFASQSLKRRTFHVGKAYWYEVKVTYYLCIIWFHSVSKERKTWPLILSNCFISFCDWSYGNRCCITQLQLRYWRKVDICCVVNQWLVVTLLWPKLHIILCIIWLWWNMRGWTPWNSWMKSERRRHEKF